MRHQSTPERKDVSSLLACPHIQHAPQTGTRVPISHTFWFSQRCWYKVDSYVFYSVQMHIKLLFNMVLIEESRRWQLSQSLVRADYSKSCGWHTSRRLVSPDSPSKFLISRDAGDDAWDSTTERQSRWLYSQQRCIAVWPLRSKAAGSAPCLNNISTMLGCWVITARCRGVWGKRWVQRGKISHNQILTYNFKQTRGSFLALQCAPDTFGLSAPSKMSSNDCTALKDILKGPVRSILKGSTGIKWNQK